MKCGFRMCGGGYVMFFIETPSIKSTFSIHELLLNEYGRMAVRQWIDGLSDIPGVDVGERETEALMAPFGSGNGKLTEPR